MFGELPAGGLPAQWITGPMDSRAGQLLVVMAAYRVKVGDDGQVVLLDHDTMVSFHCWRTSAGLGG
jgi:hypothetical protein